MVSMFSKIIFIVVTIMIFEHEIFAPWHIQPDKPPEDEIRNCEGWITYHGFKADPRENRLLAKHRERKFDPDVSLWAAGYASILVSDFQSEYRPSYPWEYCFLNEAFSEIVQHHKALKDTKANCKFWIRLFGYDQSSILHRLRAINERFKEEDNYISIWALFYIQFILDDRENATISMEQFCFDIGKNTGTEADMMPFMSLHETRLACQEWIELAGFTDNIENNYKLLNSLHPKYHEIIFHSLTKQFINEMRKSEWPYTLKSKAKRKPKPMNPEDFCELISCPLTYKLEFFNYPFDVCN